MEWVETTGRTIEEAKEAALDELGVDEHDAEFEVLEEPKLGLFGRIRNEGRVRARVRPTTPRAKDDRRDRRRRSRSSRTGAGDEAAPDRAAAGNQPAPAAPPRRRPAAAAGDQPSDSATPGDRDATPPAEGVDTAQRIGPAGSPDAGTGVQTEGSSVSAGAPRRRRRGGRGGSRAAATGSGPGDDPLRRPPPTDGARPAAPAPTDGASHGGRTGHHATDGYPDRTQEESESLMDVALEEQGQVAEQFVTGLLDAFGVAASIEVIASDEDDRVDVKVDGDDLGLLIGPKGATLLAIQDLARTAVLQHTKARNGRLYIDVARYREKRAVALAGFASRVAADVLSSGRPIALEPMNPADRKLVHDTVTSIEGVETRSVGEDERRHVVIAPTAPAAPAEATGV